MKRRSARAPPRQERKKRIGRRVPMHDAVPEREELSPRLKLLLQAYRNLRVRLGNSILNANRGLEKMQ